MRVRLPLVLAALLAVAADAPAPRWPIALADDAPVQRVALPAAALAASRSTGLGDLHVVDARGRPMPVAATAPAPAEHRESPVPLPILGPADDLRVRGVTIRYDAAGRAVGAQVSGTEDAAGGVRTTGVLLDRGRSPGAVQRLELSVAVPPGQPVHFAVTAGGNLSTWSPAGERTVYAAPPGGVQIATIEMDAAAGTARYLRIGWRADGRLLGRVAVQGAALIGAVPNAMVRITASPPPLDGAHATTFAVPFATPIVSVRVIPTGDDLVVPVRILGRDDAERPWTPIATGVAARRAAAIDLGGARFRTLRIVGDAPGLSATPCLELAFEPRALLFLAAGTPPYTLTLGGAEGAVLPAAMLLAEAHGGPVGEARVAADEPVLRLASPDGGTRRRLALWTVLVGATLVLAALAWLLWRRTAATA